MSWPGRCGTTTLALRVLAGHVEAGAEPTARVVGAGVVSIHLPDLARQLASLRVAAPDPADQVLTLARFGAFFLGGLWRVYRPPLVTFGGRRTEGRA
jgi:cholesterol oxidase